MSWALTTHRMPTTDWNPDAEEMLADGAAPQVAQIAHRKRPMVRHHHSIRAFMRCEHRPAAAQDCRRTTSDACVSTARFATMRARAARLDRDPRSALRLVSWTHALACVSAHARCAHRVEHKRTAAAWLRAVRRCEGVISTLVEPMAGRVGFEPTWVFRPNSFSRRARSTALSPPRGGDARAADWRPLPVWRLWGDSNARPLPPQGSALIH